MSYKVVHVFINMNNRSILKQTAPHIIQCVFKNSLRFKVQPLNKGQHQCPNMSTIQRFHCILLLVSCIGKCS